MQRRHVQDMIEVLGMLLHLFAYSVICNRLLAVLKETQRAA